MVGKKTSVSRVFQMLFDEVDRRGDTLEMVAKVCELRSASVLVQCWRGVLIIPISYIPGIARYLGVDPAWLLRIYLEDHLPDTMKMIEQCGLSMLVTERERELLLAYRRATGGQDLTMTINDDGKGALKISWDSVAPPG